MPTNPTTPNPNAAVDRLTLGVDSPRSDSARGTEPSSSICSTPCGCFESD